MKDELARAVLDRVYLGYGVPSAIITHRELATMKKGKRSIEAAISAVLKEKGRRR